MDAYERMLVAGVQHVGVGVLSGLSDWKRDWAMLMLHEEYLRQHCRRGATILGIPRLKRAPGALLQESPFTPIRQEFLVTVALHNIFSPATAAFVSTREDWALCVELARGGGCLFALNCSTTPGGYSLHYGGCQFTAHSYDAPTYSTKLESEGLDPIFHWKPTICPASTGPRRLSEMIRADNCGRQAQSISQRVGTRSAEVAGEIGSTV